MEITWNIYKLLASSSPHGKVKGVCPDCQPVCSSDVATTCSFMRFSQDVVCLLTIQAFQHGCCQTSFEQLTKNDNIVVGLSFKALGFVLVSWQFPPPPELGSSCNISFSLGTYGKFVANYAGMDSQQVEWLLSYPNFIWGLLFVDLLILAS